jgi:calcium-dependent protein kinase
MGACKSLMSTKPQKTFDTTVKTEKNGVEKPIDTGKDTYYHNDTQKPPNPDRKSAYQIPNNTNQDIGDFAINNNLLVSKGEGDPLTLLYNKISLLGEGSFGQVWKVKHNQTGNIRAMKIIKKSKNEKKETEQEIINEIDILKKMDHPHIVKIFEFYSTNDSYFLITEFCKEGELFKQIIDNAPFNESFTAYIMYQVLSSVFYCHNQNIIHRDLKPENILIEKKERNGYFRVKIIDFGTAKLFEKNKAERKVIGSSYYIAPEVLSKNYNEKCDLWSCGVIMYILLTGKPPFGGDNDAEILSKIKTGFYDLQSPPWNSISKEAKSLITSLLQKTPNNRISAEASLTHQWFKNLKTKEKLNEIKTGKIEKKYIQNLKTFRSDKILTQAALAYLVHNMSHLEEVQDACRLFNRIDQNGDGRITKEELLTGLKQFISLSDETLEDDTEKIFKTIDGDNNGYIEYEEFVRAAIDKEKLLTDEVLKFAFNFFDKDNSGEITAEEIKKVFDQSFRNKDANTVDQQLKKMINEVDLNGDGKIQFEEFKIMMKTILKEN